MLPFHSVLLFMLTTVASFTALPADEIADQLNHLTGNDTDLIEKAIAHLAQLPLDEGRQRDISVALNELDRDQVRQLAEPALAVWATEENIPLLINILKEKSFDRNIVLDIAQRLNDDRMLQPFVDILRDPFDDGKRAEAILTKWGKSVDEIVIRNINHSNDEAHNRIVRIWETRKLSADARTLQSALDLGAQEEETRKYAAEWLAEVKSVPDSVRKQATASALEILKDDKGFQTINAAEIIARLGHEDFRKEYIKLLESKDFHQWQAGLHGVILCKDVSCAKAIFSRMDDEAFSGQVSKIMTRHGEKSELLALALLKQPIEKKRGYGHLVVCGILEEVGTKKSLSAVNILAKKRGVPPNVNNAAQVAANNIVSRLQVK